jgi:hypothetical protein
MNMIFRLRRDGRRAVEDSDRVRASLHAPDPKLATKNPARVLPDVAGTFLLLAICKLKSRLSTF